IDRINAVAAMEFSQVGPQHPVLCPRENPVADELIERHAATPRAVLRHHARADDRGRIAFKASAEKIRQSFRSILTVAMNQSDIVIAPIDGIPVAKILIST